MKTTLAKALAEWRESLKCSPIFGQNDDDEAALRESWNTYTDSLAKAGKLCSLQFEFAPAYGDAMPQDDRAHILASLGVTLDAVFVPFSKSRNAREKQPSLNWRLTLRRDSREVLTFDYMQGSGHCPAYKKPTKFSSGKVDRYTTDQRIATECETGRVAAGASTSIFTTKGAIPTPSVVEAVWCLLSDGRAADCADFEDWAGEYGYDKDSRSAEAIYRACLDTGLKMRSSFGAQRIEQLNELFEDV